MSRVTIKPLTPLDPMFSESPTRSTPPSPAKEPEVEDDDRQNLKDPEDNPPGGAGRHSRPEA